ncbi:MAG: phosphatase PAP2 family protein [Alphaproteobacteria bacterium]|nr:phosphatase PAP2 family protein [Alphaproteobacteria bacterium]
MENNEVFSKSSVIYTKIQWALVFFIFFIDVVWLSFSSFKLYYDLRDLWIYVLILLSLYIPYLLYKKYRPNLNIMAALLSSCWLLSFSGAALILSYLADTTNEPLVTAHLASMDRYLGVYSPSIVMWGKENEWINLILVFSYACFLFQKPFVLLYFAFVGKIDYQQSFMMQYMIAGLLTILLGAAFPAEGTYAWYHFHPNAGQSGDLKSLYEVRNHIVDLRTLTGIIEFPSFHTVMGALTICIFRNEKKVIFIPILILNILLFISCVSHGGHFLMDVLGGILVAAVAIGIEILIFKSIKRVSLKKS